MSVQNLILDFLCMEYSFGPHVHDPYCNIYGLCDLKYDSYFRRIKECDHDEKEHEFFIKTIVEIEETYRKNEKHSEQ